MTKKTIKQAIALLLTITMVCTLLTGYVFSQYGYGHVPINRGKTLDCFGWSYGNIKANAATLAESGYKNVLVSPSQVTAAATAGLTFADWEKLYDVTEYSFESSNSALGTGAEFEQMCEELDKYEIAVISQVVVGDGVTGDPVEYINSLTAYGADGFCIIGSDSLTVADGYWADLISAANSFANSNYDKDVFFYAEAASASAIAAYMPVTDDWGIALRDTTVVGGDAEAFLADFDASLIHRVETRGQYMADIAGATPAAELAKAWALLAARKDAMAVYLARPSGPDAALGSVTNNDWRGSAVQQANKFSNYFDGYKEHLLQQGSYVAVERGTLGSTVVNLGGYGGSISMACLNISAGNYTDQISGNTFTVFGGKLSGNIGSTGVAFVYNPTVRCTHATHDISGWCNNCYQYVEHSYVDGVCACGAVQDLAGKDWVLYFDNSISGWDSVNVYAWDDYGTAHCGSWPGTPATLLEDGTYKAVVDGAAANVIFCNSAGTQQTEDLKIEACAVYKRYDEYTSITGYVHDFSLERCNEQALLNPGTCTTNEEYGYTCINNCTAISTDKTFYKEGTTIPHILEYKEEVIGDCFTRGIKAHWLCSTCSGAFADENGINQYTAEELVIACPHTPGEGNVCTTCQGLLLSTFPDEVFRRYISETFDTDGNGALSAEEIKGATSISIQSGEYGYVYDIKGIEQFSELESLSLPYHRIEEADLKSNTKLKYIYLMDNRIKTLDLSGLADITTLNINSNSFLEKLDLTGCTSLKTILMEGLWALNSIDLSDQGQLIYLSCKKSRITSLDLSANPFIGILDCSSTALTSLDLSNNTALSTFNGKSCYTTASCCGNRMDMSLYGDITRMTNISGGTMDAKGRLIPTEGATQITYDYLTGFGDKVLSVSLDLEKGVCGDTDGDGSCDKCGSLAVTAASFPDDNLRSYILNNIAGAEDGFLTQAELAAVGTLNIRGQGISDLSGIEYFVGLEHLYAADNNISAYDFSKTPRLRTLHCANNRFTEIDASALDYLDTLYVSDNPDLTTLKPSTNMFEVYAANCALTSLDLSGCDWLAQVVLKNNQLSYLDLPQGYSNTIYGVIFDISDQSRSITIDHATMGFDMSTIVPDLSKVVITSGGTLVGNTLVVDQGATEVCYTYDTAGDNILLAVTLKVTNPHTHSFDGDGNCTTAGQEHVCSHTDMANGICPLCGMYQAPTLVDGVYQIANAGNLIRFGTIVNGGEKDAKGLVIADIDLENREWTPIEGFIGSFDGAGHTIKGLYISVVPSGGCNLGFFNTIKSPAVVKDFTIEGTIKATVMGKSPKAVGVIAMSGENDMANGGTVSGITSKIALQSTAGIGINHMGGVVGAMYGGRVEKCFFNGKISYNGSSITELGGIVGYGQAGTIDLCGNMATISTAYNHAGGILGYVNNASTHVTNCYNYGKVYTVTTGYAGAIVGRLRAHGTISGNYYNSELMTDPYGPKSEGDTTGVQATAMTADSFTSGELAWTMNGRADNGRWKQSLDGATFPGFSGGGVYRIEDLIRCDNVPLEQHYANEPGGETKYADHQYSDTGVCIYCTTSAGASVIVNGTESFYDYFDTALAYALSAGTKDSPATLKLLLGAEAFEDIVLKDNHIILDLNDKTLSYTKKGGKLVLENSTLAIKDSGTNQVGELSFYEGGGFDGAMQVRDDSKLTIAGGSIYAKTPILLQTEGNGTIEQTGGTLGCTYALAMYGGTYTLKGGTLNAYTCVVFSNGSGGTVNIEGGNLNTCEFFSGGGADSFNITGGTISSTREGRDGYEPIEANAPDGGVLSISGGTFVHGLTAGTDGTRLVSYLADGYEYRNAQGETIVLTEGQTQIAEEFFVDEATIRLDITWGALEFTYSSGTWNTETLSYDGIGWSCEDGANKITVTSHCNKTVELAVVYTTEYADVSLTTTDAGGTPVKTVTVPAFGENSLYLAVAGSPKETMEKRVLGTVKIILGGN